jgi:hypothetical protein
MKGRVYISGKVSGMESEAKVIFDKAEERLKADGYEVVNPMKLPHNHDKSWASYMAEDIRALVKCNFVFMLGNWKDSRGARVEHEIAKHARMVIMYEKRPSTWI